MRGKTLILLCASFISFILAFSNISPLLAKTAYKKIAPTTIFPSPTPTPTPTLVDSYTLFWPVVAGRTADDKLYFVKELKERARGFLIFKGSKRADYEVQLATKRVVEAEKLYKANKEDALQKTLNKMENSLSIAAKKIKESNPRGMINANAEINIKNQLENLKVFLPYLRLEASKDVQNKIDSILNKVSEIQSLL